MNNIFLISVATLKANAALNANIDESYILPAISYAQDEGLQPIIGTVLYDKLKSLVADGSITGETEYKLLLDEYIQPYLLNKVVADIQIPIAYKTRNQGVSQMTDANIYSSTMKDVQYLVEFYANRANFYANRMSDYLIANNSKYPEYRKINTCADMPSNPNAYNTHIYLG